MQSHPIKWHCLWYIRVKICNLTACCANYKRFSKYRILLKKSIWIAHKCIYCWKPTISIYLKNKIVDFKHKIKIIYLRNVHDRFLLRFYLLHRNASGNFAHFLSNMHFVFFIHDLANISTIKFFVVKSLRRLPNSVNY